jgi:carboxyl-terminal processing protease
MSIKNGCNKRKFMWWIVGIVIIVGGLVWLVRRLLLPSSNDYQDLSWTASFDQLHAELSQKYPFTEWKGLDWDALYAETAPRIAEAEANDDQKAFYLALRQYAGMIPDGHVEVGGDDFGLREEAIGGGYGLGIIGLDDGRVIAHLLLDNGPAAKAGMAWGVEILTWNGLPITEAVAQTPIIWADVNPATAEGRKLEQYRYLVRNPMGTEVTLTFQNPGSDVVQTATLTAEADELETIKRTLPPEKELAMLFKSPVQWQVLPNGYGYLAINGFMPTLAAINLGKEMETAVSDLITQDVPGIIIDVRSNSGGIDTLVPKLASYFVTEPAFYEQIARYDETSEEFVVNPEETLLIEPSQLHYDGPVVVLVNKQTASTAEGVPLVLQRLGRGQVVGLYGTNGSFAMGTPGQDLYQLPEGIAFNFLAGRSLDAEGQIQVDTNADGVGGVEPDVRVPLTEETIHAMFVEGRDVVLETAVSTLDNMQALSQ